MASHDDNPRLVRPVPRRPVQLNLMGPSPSPSAPGTPTLADQQQEDEQLLSWRAALPPTSAFARLLNSQLQSSFNDGASTPPPPSTPGLSRSDSAANLTGSTLYGIYRDMSSTSLAGKAGDVTDTPWGTGAQTPIRAPDVDDRTFELMRKRAGSASRPPLSTIPTQPNQPSYRKARAAPHEQPAGAVLGPVVTKSPLAGAFSLLMRVGLLFILGMGYGTIVGRLHDEHNLGTFTGDPARGRRIEDGPISPLYIACWGTMGVLLGVVLPWFDSAWERSFREGNVAEDAHEIKAATDWALVIRAIGAFVGIAFAIRKLPWTSTLQVSATLALTNPFLWYLIDGSTPGFVLSAFVGIVGTLVLLQVNPGIMPSPLSHLSQSTLQNGHDSHGLNNSAAWSSPDGGAKGVSIADSVLVLGGLVSEETVVTAIWMMSVLFCSCLCFGNIGRRLGFSRPAMRRGRWVGLR